MCNNRQRVILNKYLLNERHLYVTSCFSLPPWKLPPLSHVRDVFFPSLLLMPSGNTAQGLPCCPSFHHHSVAALQPCLCVLWRNWGTALSLQVSFPREPTSSGFLRSFFNLHFVTPFYALTDSGEAHGCCNFSSFLLLPPLLLACSLNKCSL